MNGDFEWDKFIARVENLQCQEKAALLAKAAYELTIEARDTYEPGTLSVSNPSRLRGINEVMHRLTRRILTLSRGAENDWKEVDFWQALQEISQGSGCAGDLVSAVRKSVQ